MLFDPKLDLCHHQARLRDVGVLQIRGVLVPETAQELSACLLHDVAWTLAWHDHQHQISRSMTRDEYHGMPLDRRRQFLGQLAQASLNRYGFAYEQYPMITAYQEAWSPAHRLHRLVDELNSEPFLEIARQLTGLSEIRRVSAQATRYSAGHFLRMHTDDVPEEGRLAAYVLNLTPSWNVDFGGLLHFVDKHGSIEEVYFPWFNSLSLFKVPRWHFVSMVMPWASSPRLSITGWFRR